MLDTTMLSRPPQNYPKVFIDKSTLIKPCTVEQSTTDQFVDKPKSGWTRLYQETKQQGLPYILNYLDSLTFDANSNIYFIYFIKVLQYLTLLITNIHQIYLNIYGYLYPYSLLSVDEVSDEFAKCCNWSKAVIRAFAWHPNHNRCAIALCNDYIYIYDDANRSRVLRHNQQRKILDLAWHPANKEILVVASQTNIIIWSIHGGSDLTSALKEGNILTNVKSLIPGYHPSTKSRLMNHDETGIKNDSTLSPDISNRSNLSQKNIIILDRILPSPIVSIQFDKETQKLYCCSPNSSKIAVIDVDSLVTSRSQENKKPSSNHIKYLRQFGQGFTRLAWSPKFNRLATGTISRTLRIYEPFQWSNRQWSTGAGLIHDLAWSMPSGSMLLLATKDEPYVYSLPFLDEPLPKDVGGNKSLMKALDLSETKNESGDTIGGRIQSLVWDKDGRRLAISFKDNPNSVLLYRTTEKPTLEFHQMGIIQGEKGSSALLMQFHDNYKKGSLLTICWSEGNCQHIPLHYSTQESSAINNQSFVNRNDNGYLNGNLNISIGSMNASRIDSTTFNATVNSPSKTARSLTSFCHVVGNNSISSTCSPLLMRHKCLTKLQEANNITGNNGSIFDNQ